MKRLLLTLLCVLFAYPCFAGEPIQLARMNPWVAGSGVATTADPCGCPDVSYKFCYTGDYSGDAKKACYKTPGGVITQKAGTTGGSPTITSDYVSYSAINTYLQFAVENEDGFSDSVGTMYFSLYLTDEGDATLEGGAIIELYGVANSTNNSINTYSYPSNTGLRCLFTGDADVESNIKNGALTTGAWFRAGVSWDVANSKLAVSIVALGSAHSWDVDDDTLTAWHVDDQPASITIGRKLWGLDVSDIPVLIKDVIIFGEYYTSADDPF